MANSLGIAMKRVDERLSFDLNIKKLMANAYKYKYIILGKLHKLITTKPAVQISKSYILLLIENRDSFVIGSAKESVEA